MRGFEFCWGGGGLVLIMGKERVLILGEGEGHMGGSKRRGEV